MANSTSGLPSSSRMKATNRRRPARIAFRTRDAPRSNRGRSPSPVARRETGVFRRPMVGEGWNGGSRRPCKFRSRSLRLSGGATPLPNPPPQELAPGRAQARPGWGRGCRAPSISLTRATSTDRALQRSCRTSSLPSLSRTKTDDGAPRRRQSLFAAIAPVQERWESSSLQVAQAFARPLAGALSARPSGRCRQFFPAAFLSSPRRLCDSCFVSEIIARALPDRRLSRRYGRRILFDDALLTLFTTLQ